MSRRSRPVNGRAAWPLRLWPALPRRVDDIDLGRFAAWLRRQGLDVEEPREDGRLLLIWEPRTWVTIDATADGELRWRGSAASLYSAFELGFSIGPTRPEFDAQRQAIAKYLRRRDGDDCWYCGRPMVPTDATVEHLIPRLAGGTDHEANLVLAHEACNARAGALPLAHKIALRERMQGGSG